MKTVKNTANTVFISYDNERSIKAKCEYVITNHLAGVMAWEAGCNKTNELILAVKEGLNK